MHPNQATLEKFYNAFAQLDADTMATCYAPDAQFDDEAFSLRGHGHRSCRKKSALPPPRI